MAKLKRLDFEAWQYRIPDKALLMESQKLVEIDNLLLEAAERLSGITEFTTYAYTSQYEKMDEAVRIYDALIHLQEGVNNELQEIDNDFFLRLANGTDRKHQGPMEALSSIHMEDISIPNQAGITRQWVYYNTSNQRCLGEAEKKEELTFQDFLCYSKDTEYETVYNPIFQEIFQEQYELSGLTQDYTYIEYMDGLLKAGEFNHEMYKPVQEFLSAGLDIITFGAKPLIEAFVGEDLITGEQMTETERYLRAIEGIVGLVSFGSIWSKLGKIGIEGVTAELAIEVMSDTSSTITSTSMNKLGANGIVSTVAGIIAGGITGSSINNAINTRVWSSHIETPEVPETPFQIQRETIQVEELPNRIDIDTRNNLSQLDGLEENQVGKRIMESYDNLDEIEELYKNIMDEQRMVDMEYDDFLNEIRELSVEEVRLGDGINIIELSKNNIQHIKKHTFEGMVEQAKYLTDEQFANKLANTTFFSKNWSQDEIVMYTQEAYNILRSQGKTGLHSVEMNGEIINVFIKEDGTFDTAYGVYQYTVNDFR